MRAAALAVLSLAGCMCPDTHHEQKPLADRMTYGAQIDACLANDMSCEALCRAVLQLDPTWTITKCIVIDETTNGVQLDVAYFNASACLG